MDYKLYEQISTIIKKAKEDPVFFHELIFDTEKALAKLDVDRSIKGRILATTPENALATLLGFSPSMCDFTCGMSCALTCYGWTWQPGGNIYDYPMRQKF